MQRQLRDVYSDSWEVLSDDSSRFENTPSPFLKIKASLERRTTSAVGSGLLQTSQSGFFEESITRQWPISRLPRRYEDSNGDGKF